MDCQDKPALPMSITACKTFFDLPAEIRNAIYEEVAECNLRLWGHPHGHKKFPGLLLASEQCREEYMSVLLATARITPTITDMNFSKLLDTIEKLDVSEREALWSNRNVVINLRIRKCGSDVYANLRRWCKSISAYTTEDGDEDTGFVSSKWQYAMDAADESSAAQLDWYCGRIRVLEQRVQDDRVKAEVRKIMEIVESKRAGQSSMGSWSMGSRELGALRSAAEARRS